MLTVQETYKRLANTKSDIQYHLPLLYTHGRGVVLELGVRTGVSTSALLAGVIDHGGDVWSVDTNPACSNTFSHSQWHFIHANSLDYGTIEAAGLPQSVDTLFIDTVHTFEHTLQELELWGKRVQRDGIILLHDTDDPGTHPGVRNAMASYCDRHGFQFWCLPESNGMGVIVKE